MSLSLDGYSAGPNMSVANPMGDGGSRLHEWIFAPDGYDRELVEFNPLGAVIIGRNMFNTGEQPWGENPPFHLPVFVLTHEPREAAVKEGGTTFAFVPGGIESALEQARAAAGDKDILVGGGANTSGIRFFENTDSKRIELERWNGNCVD